MTKRALVRAARAVCMVLMLSVSAGPTAAAQPLDSEKALTKLTRGVVNILTGWVEIPKRLMETTQISGPAAGFTWGILRGAGHGFIRTTTGLYEMFTFPFPAPPGYVPILHPEYVFTAEPLLSTPAPSSRDSYDY